MAWNGQVYKQNKTKTGKKEKISDHLYSCSRHLKGTRNFRHFCATEAPVLVGYLEKEPEAGILPTVHLLDDFSKFIKARGHKHSRLLQSLVLGYCSFRSLVGTRSGMAKLYLEGQGQRLYWACKTRAGEDKKGSWERRYPLQARPCSVFHVNHFIQASQSCSTGMPNDSRPLDQETQAPMLPGGHTAAV